VPNKDGVTGEWRTLHNEELQDVYCIKPSTMKWVGHVAVWKTGEVRVGSWWRKLMERDNLEYLVIDGRILLK